MSRIKGDGMIKNLSFSAYKTKGFQSCGGIQGWVNAFVLTVSNLTNTRGFFFERE